MEGMMNQMGIVAQMPHTAHIAQPAQVVHIAQPGQVVQMCAPGQSIILASPADWQGPQHVRQVQPVQQMVQQAPPAHMQPVQQMQPVQHMYPVPQAQPTHNVQQVHLAQAAQHVAVAPPPQQPDMPLVGEVRFADPHSVPNAIALMNNTWLGQSIIRVVQDGGCRNGSRVLVSGISLDTSKQILQEYFEQPGPVAFCGWKGKGHKGGKGFAMDAGKGAEDMVPMHTAYAAVSGTAIGEVVKETFSQVAPVVYAGHRPQSSNRHHQQMVPQVVYPPGMTI